MSESSITDAAAEGSLPTNLWRRLRWRLSTNSDGGQAGQAAATVFLIRVASAAIAYLSQIVLARAIGVVDYGIFVAAWSLILILGHLSGLGFSLSVTRLVPELKQGNDRQGLAGLFNVSRLAGLLCASLVAAMLIALIGFVNVFSADQRLTPTLIVLLCLPFFTLTEIQDGLARCFNLPLLALGPPYILRPLAILLLLGLALALGGQAGAAMAASCAALATLIVAFVQFGWLSRTLKQETGLAAPRYRWLPWLAASLPLLVSEGSRIVLQNSDVLVLSLLAGPQEVAAYFAVTKTMVLGAFVAFAVNAAVSHRFAAYHVAGATEQLAAFVRQSTRWVFWPTLASVALMQGLGKPFLSLFGPSFLSAYPLMFVLGAGLVVRAAIGPAERLLAALGDQRICARIYVATLIVGLMLQIGLSSAFGAFGLAVAGAITLVVETVLLAAALQKRHGMAIGVWLDWLPRLTPDRAKAGG